MSTSIVQPSQSVVSLQTLVCLLQYQQTSISVLQSEIHDKPSSQQVHYALSQKLSVKEFVNYFNKIQKIVEKVEEHIGQVETDIEGFIKETTKVIMQQKWEQNKHLDNQLEKRMRQVQEKVEKIHQQMQAEQQHSIHHLKYNGNQKLFQIQDVLRSYSQDITMIKKQIQGLQTHSLAINSQKNKLNDKSNHRLETFGSSKKKPLNSQQNQQNPHMHCSHYSKKKTPTSSRKKQKSSYISNNISMQKLQPQNIRLSQILMRQIKNIQNYCRQSNRYIQQLSAKLERYNRSPIHQIGENQALRLTEELRIRFDLFEEQMERKLKQELWALTKQREEHVRQISGTEFSQRIDLRPDLSVSLNPSTRLCCPIPLSDSFQRWIWTWSQKIGKTTLHTTSPSIRVFPILNSSSIKFPASGIYRLICGVFPSSSKSFNNDYHESGIVSVFINGICVARQQIVRGVYQNSNYDKEDIGQLPPKGCLIKISKTVMLYVYGQEGSEVKIKCQTQGKGDQQGFLQLGIF